MCRPFVGLVTGEDKTSGKGSHFFVDLCHKNDPNICHVIIVIIGMCNVCTLRLIV